jgi:hypothetical protein
VLLRRFYLTIVVIDQSELASKSQLVDQCPCGLILRLHMLSQYETRKTASGAVSCHEYQGSFKGESAFFKMTSVCGHVLRYQLC